MHINPALIVIEFLAFLFALSVHECAHAWVAHLRGDDTARLLGRVTLNPLRHIELFGSVIFPLLMLFSGTGWFFGWARPTPVDVSRLRHRKWDDILVALAGPASNMLVAILAAGALVGLRTDAPGRLSGFIASPQSSSGWLAPLANLAYFSLVLNIVLAVFNLIPIPPLDGSHILGHLLPAGLSGYYRRLYSQGWLCLLLLIGAIYLNVPGILFSPVVLAFGGVFHLNGIGIF